MVTHSFDTQQPVAPLAGASAGIGQVTAIELARCLSKKICCGLRHTFNGLPVCLGERHKRVMYFN